MNVYIITDGKNGKDVNRVAHLFQDDIYNVMEAIVPPLDKLNEEMEAYSDKDELYSLYQVQWCLEQSRTSHPNRPVLVIRDSSISLMDQDRLKELMIEIMDNDKDYDMFYLCKWNDDCQKYVDNRTYAGINVARTYAACGSQAVYFSTRGRDIMVGRKVMWNDRYLRFTKSVDKKIVKQFHVGNIVAYCTLHNIFEFDISKATRNSDFNKISPCSVMLKNIKKESNATTNLGYLWFVIIVILIIILAFAIARIGK